MKLEYFMLPILATFVLAIPMTDFQDDDDIAIYNIKAEDLQNIHNLFAELRGRFIAHDIDPKEYYCKDSYNYDVLNKISALPELLKKVNDFKTLIEQFEYTEDEFFCI